MYLVFSAFTSRPVSLLAITKPSDSAHTHASMCVCVVGGSGRQVKSRHCIFFCRQSAPCEIAGNSWNKQCYHSVEASGEGEVGSGPAAEKPYCTASAETQSPNRFVILIA
jgi:hypothetical protein